MKESYTEGLASHSDPESCGGVRKDAAEALTGAHTGRVLSPENFCNQGADDVKKSGRQNTCMRHGECTSGPAWSETSGIGCLFLSDTNVDPALRQAINTMPAGDWLRVRIVGQRKKSVQ